MASAEKERDRVEEKLAEVLPEMDKLQAGGHEDHNFFFYNFYIL